MRKQHWIQGFMLMIGGGLCQNALAVPVKSYVMHIQILPALCIFEPLSSRKRKCQEGYALNVAGLYPQDVQKDCTTQSSPNLAPLQGKVLAKVMPDEVSRKQLWKTWGGCVPMNVSQYFRLIIKYSERLQIPTQLSGIERNQYVQRSVLKSKFIQLNPGLTDGAFKLQCRTYHGENLLIGINVCYSNSGQYQKCAPKIVEDCPQDITIKGSF